MSQNENPTLLQEVNEEGETVRLVSAGMAFAKDDSYKPADLKPSLIDMEDVRESIQGGIDSEFVRQTWEELRQKPYDELRALANGMESRVEELRHRIHSEAEAIENGRLPQEGGVFSGEHHYYANYLAFRASAARQAIRAIEEKGEPPEWEKLPGNDSERRRALRGIAEDHTEDLKAFVDYLEEAPSTVLSDTKSEVFSSVFEDDETQFDVRWNNWWTRAGLEYPSTVKDLKTECEEALKLKREFPL